MSRVRRAFLMASLEQYLTLAINFLMVAVLSRMLSPAAIGVAVLGMGISVIIFSLREFVTPEFLIQRTRVEREDVRTALTILLGVHIVLATLLFVLSPVVARYYGELGLRHFLPVMIAAASVEMTSFPAVALLRRDMNFGAIARIRAISLTVMALTTIGLAAFGFSFMSYAWGTLAASSTTACLALIARRDAYDMRPSLASWRMVYEFGRFRGAASFVDRAHDMLPQVVLGRFMPAAAVGIYNRTNAVCAIPDRVFLGAIFAMAFPALAAEVREGRLVQGHYLRAIGYITALYWPALILLAILAHPVVNFILGHSWAEAVPLVRIMALASLFFFPVILTHPILMALGLNREAFYSTAVSRALSVVILCAASPMGLTAMAASQFLAIPLQMFVSFKYVKKHVDFRWSELFHVLWMSAVPTAGATAAALAVVGLSGFRFDLSFAEACLAGVAAGMGWLAGAVLVRHPVLDEIRRVLPVPARWRLSREVSAGGTVQLSNTDAG
ncbi:oligosaccharide flippase family protein [Chelativorans sp. YIM 93263]|uniref:oligosaccharide flippase family protein n=1 Tax=Chelativorans sp. YIM 93263 TaxID=2906648 RepID=UPI002377DB6E|nr:oligosaccharide flippase family protein [Chelativorans sp. YIM 93263]